jgi:type I restriction enzyme, S subunit
MGGEWTEARLGDLCDFRAGVVFKPVLQGQTSGEFPFVKVSDMNLPANAVRIQDANNWVSAADLRELRAKPFPPGTVVFAKIGEALRQNRLRQIARETVVDNNMMGAVPRINRIDPRFFYYALSRFDFSDIAQGTALPYLTVSSLSALSLDLPPPDEQRAIAHILGTLDDKIELNRRMSETLEALARALFKSWFVDFEPVRAKMEGRDSGLPDAIADLFPDRLVDSELGEIPEGWEVKSLDQIARFLNGLALQKHPPVDGRSLPVIKIAQLRAGNTAGADRASADLDADYIVRDGDILFSWSGSLECRLWAGGSGALNQHLFKVTSDRYPRWLCYLGIHQHIDDFRHIAAGKATTMGHIQRHHLSDAKLAVPPPGLLHPMGATIEPIIESTWRRAVQSRTLAALRDALLPKLISGELRVESLQETRGHDQP